MKRIINGILYDTEKAVLLKEKERAKFSGPFIKYNDLYKGKNGNFFIVVYGVDYVVEGIVAVSKEEAEEIMDFRDEVEIYEKYFGKITEA